MISGISFPILIPNSRELIKSISACMKIANNLGDNTPPCLTSIVDLNEVENFSSNWMMMNFENNFNPILLI